MKTLFAVVIFVLGACLGSFLNVVIYRVPQKDSIVSPPSSCPHCHHRLAYSDLIPIFSFFALKGKCRYCGSPISLQYPIVEVLVAILSLVLYLLYGISLQFFSYLVFFCILVVLSFIDLNTGYVYDIISVPSIFVGLLFSIFNKSIVSSLLGVVVASAFFGAIILISKLFYKEGGMGEGDLLVAILIASFLGLKLSIVAFVFSFLFGSVIGIILMFVYKKEGSTAIPFVPYLVLGSLFAVFFGRYILLLYGV
ncbi:MAG: prepilin peptidase [Conexivisphaerales archaeon]